MIKTLIEFLVEHRYGSIIGNKFNYKGSGVDEAMKLLLTVFYVL